MRRVIDVGVDDESCWFSLNDGYVSCVLLRIYEGDSWRMRGWESDGFRVSIDALLSFGEGIVIPQLIDW